MKTDTMKSRAPVAIHKPVTFGEWLKRKKAGPKPRKPIPKVTAKRAKANREYSVRSKRYLLLHPYCQIFITRHRLVESAVIASGGIASIAGYWIEVPRSDQIHHSKKPKCKYLNDESTWFSACFEQHQWVEDHKDLARQLGLLCNN